MVALVADQQVERRPEVFERVPLPPGQRGKRRHHHVRFPLRFLPASELAHRNTGEPGREPVHPLANQFQRVTHHQNAPRYPSGQERPDAGLPRSTRRLDHTMAHGRHGFHCFGLIPERGDPFVKGPPPAPRYRVRLPVHRTTWKPGAARPGPVVEVSTRVDGRLRLRAPLEILPGLVLRVRRRMFRLEPEHGFGTRRPEHGAPSDLHHRPVDRDRPGSLGQSTPVILPVPACIEPRSVWSPWLVVGGRFQIRELPPGHLPAHGPASLNLFHPTPGPLPIGFPFHVFGHRFGFGVALPLGGRDPVPGGEEMKQIHLGGSQLPATPETLHHPPVAINLHHRPSRTPVRDLNLRQWSGNAASHRNRPASVPAMASRPASRTQFEAVQSA